MGSILSYSTGKVCEVKTFPASRNGILSVDDDSVDLLFVISQNRKMMYAKDIKKELKQFFENTRREQKDFSIAYYDDTIYGVNIGHTTMCYSKKLNPTSFGGGILE